MTMELNWQQLPDGQDVLVQPGLYYAVLALVDVTSSTIHDKVAGYGLSIIESSYIDPVDPSSTTPPLPPPPSGYRYVAGEAVGVQGGKAVPWKVPSPWSLFDGSSMVHAWAAQPPGQSSQPLPTVSCPSAPSKVPTMVASALAGVLLFEGARFALRR